MGGSGSTLNIQTGNFSGTLAGNEVLAKNGSSALTLSGANSYSGGTDINAGTVLVSNSLALGTGQVTLNAATLSINGPLGLTIGNNYTQNAGGTLQLGFAGATTGQWDSLTINGNASLAGTLDLLSYGGFHFHDSEQFKIIAATDVTGTFGTIINGVPGDSPTLVYDPTAVYVDLAANAPSFSSLGQTYNQKQIGASLDNLAATSPTSALITYLNGLSNSQLLNAYNQLSPASITPIYKMGFSTALVTTDRVIRRVDSMLEDGDDNSDHLVWNPSDIRFAGTLSADEESHIAQNVQTVRRWDGFVDGMTDFGTVTSDGNGTGYQFSTTGTTAGVDYRFDRDWVGGFLLGYNLSNTSQSTGSVNSTRGNLGLYTGLKLDQWRVEALVSGGLDSYTTQRQGLGGTADGSTGGWEYTGQVNLSYEAKLEDIRIEPFVMGQMTNIAINAFSETGSLAPLTFNNQGETYVGSEVGAKFGLSTQLSGIRLVPNVTAGWEHVYQGNTDSLIASFGSGQSFTVNGTATGTDAVVLGGGLDAQFDRDWAFYGEYEAKLGFTNFTSQNIYGGLKFSWGNGPEAAITPAP